MKKMAVLTVFAMLSTVLLSAMPASMVAVESENVISFTGKIAISSVENVVQWRIVVDGTMTLWDGSQHTGVYTVFKMWASGDIIHGEPDLFLWRYNRCLLRKNDVMLTVAWKAKWARWMTLLTEIFPEDGDVLTIAAGSVWSAADVKGTFQAGQGMVHKTGWGYIVDGSGSLTLST